MLKTIRKYNKLILGVGGTLLLVAFLVPQAIQQLGKASQGRSVGTMDGRKITVADYDRATRELTAVESFYAELGMGLPIALDQREDVAHWMLLTREAERAGMVGGAAEGAQLLPVFAEMLVRSSFEQQYQRMAQQVMLQFPDQVRAQEEQAMIGLGRIKQQVAGKARLLESEFDQTLAKLQGVLRLVNSYRYAERLSDSQTILISQRLADAVVVNSAFLSARRLMDERLEPTPEQLRAQFDAYKAVKQGEGEFGIGYLLPPRIKLEWIELSPRLMREVLTISLLDATKHWQQNRGRFPGEFEAERANVENELKTAELEKVFNTAESVVRAEILSAVRPLEQDGDYRVLPSDWASKKPDFVKMADRVVAAVQEAHGVTIPTPAVYIRDANWLDGGSLLSQPGIGSSTFRYGRETANFPQLMMTVRELAGDSVLGLQVGVPSTDLVLEGNDRSRYYFTILDAAATSVPNSPDDLLDPDRLTADWRALQKYHELTAGAEGYVETIKSDGIRAFADTFGTYVPQSNIEGLVSDPQPRVAVNTGARVTREGTSGLGPVENNELVQTALLEAGSKIDPLTPISEVSLEDRIVVVPVPRSLGVSVAQIQSIEPLTRELLPVAVRYAQQQHTRETFPVGTPMPFRYEILKQRHAFTLEKRNEDRDGDGASDVAPVEADAADATDEPAPAGSEPESITEQDG